MIKKESQLTLMSQFSNAMRMHILMELAVSGKKHTRQQGVQYLGTVFLLWLR